MSRPGVTKNTLAVGTEFDIEGCLARDGTNKAVGRNFVLADGRWLFLGGSAPGGGEARSRRAPLSRLAPARPR